MGEPTKKSKLSSTVGCSFRQLCRRNSSKRRGSMGQSKSLVYTATGNGTTKNFKVTTTTRNPLDGGTTSMVTLTAKDKSLKSRSISSLSKALRNRKWRRKRRNSISASFNMNDRDFKVEFINVNSATEEDLMTLPGVNRALARNIVNHRTQIGGFRRVEDLALVSGMGANKLDIIRTEICTSKRRNNLSRASSKSPSLESLPSSSGSGRAYRPIRLVNLNTATIFDLMGIQSINQALAAKIINYRDKKGPFKYIDDLRHVGISYRQLGAFRNFLTINSSSDLSSDAITTEIKVEPHLAAVVTPVRSTNSTSHRRSSSVPPLIIKDMPASPGGSIPVSRTPTKPSPLVEGMTEIFELMSLKSRRPLQDIQYEPCDTDRSSYRIGSWNLENLTDDKVSNPGVLEVITRTILENGCSLIAVQEICDKSALQTICDELNEPRLSRNRAWTKPRGRWNFVLDESTILHFNKTSHRLGLLYNEDQIESVTIPKSGEGFSPIQNGSIWQLSVFKVIVKQSTWILITVLSTPLSQYTNGHAVVPQHESIGDLIQGLVKESRADGGLLLGSFNSQNIEKGLGNLGVLEDISPPLDEHDPLSPPIATAGSFWVTDGMKDVFTGESGRISEGLSHLAIPNGSWSWGGRVTISEPYWCSFYVVTKVAEEN